MGQVGSGKSSLISSILGELNRVRGVVRVSVRYVVLQIILILGILVIILEAKLDKSQSSHKISFFFKSKNFKLFCSEHVCLLPMFEFESWF